MQVELCCTVYFKSLSSLSSYNQFGREEKETLNFAKSHTLHAQDRERERERENETRECLFILFFSFYRREEKYKEKKRKGGCVS